MSNDEEVGDDMLMALADGELRGPEADALQQRMLQDPALAERYAVYVETRTLLREAFAAEPVPERLVQAVMNSPAEPMSQSAANVVPLRRRASMAVGSLPRLALAATLLVAVGVSGFLAGRETAPRQVATVDPAVVAAEALARRETGDTVQLPDGQGARVLASFQTDLGLCRLIGLDGSRAVVCRDGDAWKTALAVASGDSTAFLPASDTATGLIDDLLDRIGAGAPLDPEAERAKLSR